MSSFFHRKDNSFILFMEPPTKCVVSLSSRRHFCRSKNEMLRHFCFEMSKFSLAFGAACANKKIWNLLSYLLTLDLSGTLSRARKKNETFPSDIWFACFSADFGISFSRFLTFFSFVSIFSARRRSEFSFHFRWQIFFMLSLRNSLRKSIVARIEFNFDFIDQNTRQTEFSVVSSKSQLEKDERKQSNFSWTFFRFIWLIFRCHWNEH